ncbi:hypothetical protein V8G54_000847 [Vigna mungo]|uniref:Uncharacterized protein n=1 Tax=Vigna mungo TaxID=3915 RepID=A0AAQ3P675_VIGMU
MALNPQLFPNGMPVAFVNEMFVLARDGVEFEIDKIPASGSHGGHVKTKGIIYLSNIRMVFVAKSPVGHFTAFDMPLACWFSGYSEYHCLAIANTLKTTNLYVHGEKFNQPIFHCNNLSGHVEPVVPNDQHRALYSTHSFKIIFKEGGCGTFIPLFFNLIASVRQYNQHYNMQAQSYVDPLQAAQTPVDEMMRHAYVDPNDPTKIFLQQPNSDSQLRRRTYQPQADGGHV